ncbi:caspase family protein [Candidatus Albibeggiatoa sp. nov. NOAA]|uniref:caspase family protein n=1 Tax=Candidatus Albibeggiatoa sp. nov. NOAA TaxID=3162724 RepID=UPI0033020C2E|nr:caspase family protein [Thiotrichaceae bacterium]
MAKYAVVIGVSEYPKATGDGGLKPLLRATKDAEAIAEVLDNPDIGGFDEVKLLTNPDRAQIETAIELVFSIRRSKQDVLLLYFSGHGIKDFRSGHLFLTAHNTAKFDGDLVKSTAVSSIAVHGFLTDCPSKRQIVILDCCYSGAFAEGLNAKDGSHTFDLQADLGGEGRAILTSSSSVELSYEREEGELSVYTDYLLEGIKTGSADKNEDGWVSVDEAHSYAQKRVKSEANGMNPKIYSSEDGYKIHLTKVPVVLVSKRYREQVEKYVKTGKGRISPIGRKNLDRSCQELGISKIEAQQIEKSVLFPYQRQAANLTEYKEMLAFALDESNPITEEHRIELQDLQKHLGLSKQDVNEIEKQCLDKRKQYEEFQNLLLNPVRVRE